MKYPATPRYELYIEFCDSTENVALYGDDINALVSLYYAWLPMLKQHRLFSASINRNDETNELLCILNEDVD